MKRYIKSAVQSIVDMDIQSQIEVAINTASEDIMWELLNNPNGCDWVVCLIIADNSNATEDILRELTHHWNDTVREVAASRLLGRMESNT